jgi:mannose-6-phosphate isomerase-like protein (cupin superfamily)
MDPSFEEIIHNNMVLAKIVREHFSRDGYAFFTHDDDTQQLAYMHHPAGKIIGSHIHNDIKREVYRTKEVVFIKTGKLRINFYSECKEFVCSRILEKGDVVLLSQGGHGFEMLEETEMFVVKQGPYTGESDKTRFTSRNDPD